MIVVNRDFAGTLTLGTPTASQTDFQWSIQHELGHFIGLAHDATETPCTMNPTIGAGAVDGRFPCNSTIFDVGTSVGWTRDNTQEVTNSNWPVPTGTWTNPIVTGHQFGYGFTDQSRGAVSSPSTMRDSMFFSQVNVADQVNTCDYGAGWTYPCPLSGASVNSVRRVATAYDPVRLTWWLFTVVDTGYTIDVRKSQDRVTWTSLGNLSNQSGTAVTTRLPVAATYDPQSDSILVIVTNYTPFSGPSPCGGFGCSGDMLMAGIQPSAVNANVAITNYAPKQAVGAPAIACGPSGSNGGLNCEVVDSGGDTQRQIWAFQTCATVSGGQVVSCGVGGGTWIGGGTDDQPSYANVSSTGGFAVVVRGADFGPSLIYLNEKSSISGSWSGFAPIVVNGASLRTHVGPVLRSRADGWNNWNLLSELY